RTDSCAIVLHLGEVDIESRHGPSPASRAQIHFRRHERDAIQKLRPPNFQPARAPNLERKPAARNSNPGSRAYADKLRWQNRGSSIFGFELFATPASCAGRDSTQALAENAAAEFQLRLRRNSPPASELRAGRPEDQRHRLRKSQTPARF